MSPPRVQPAHVVGGHAWTDPMLDAAVAAVRHRYLRPAVAALAEARRDWELRSLRVEALARAAVGCSQDIEALLAAEPANPDLLLWLGRTWVEEAWMVRPNPRGRAVQAAAYQAFAKRMRAARGPLLAAAERLPDDPVPWEAMMWLGLGLELASEDKEALWLHVHRRCPSLYGANVARVITLSPQWGGVAEEMFDFARVQMSTAAREDPRSALIPLAYFEYFVQERSGILRGSSRWFSDEEIRDVQSAARGWFEGSRPHPRTVEAHNLFGAAFNLADVRRPARQHLARTKGRPSRLPWSYLGDDEVAQYTKACKHLNLLAA